MYWDQEKTKCLIEDYRESRVLWDLCDSSYKDNRKNFKVWEELSKKYECSIKDLKDKIINLRTTFHRKRKQKSGSGRTEPWMYFQSLTFLLDVDVPKQSVPTEEYFDETEDETDKESDRSVSPGPSIRRNPDQHKQRAEGPSAPKNKKQRYQSERQEETDQRADEAYKILQTASQQQDEFFIYGQHVGNELRKLSSTSYHIAKHYINNILFDAAMRKYEPDVGRSENSIPSTQLYPPPLSSSHSVPDSFSYLSAPTQSHNPQTNKRPSFLRSITYSI
nr:unnamed protein product [Callosobruchus analis]